jgi:hypothetical protein
LKRAFIILAAVVLLGACEKEVSNKVDQDRIFTHYELSYDENTDVTTARATFRFSSLLGTRLMLSEPSMVSVDGMEMEWSDENGYYEKSFSGLVPSAEFRWTDLDGNIFVNTAEIRDVEFPATLPVLSHDDSVNYFMWAGLALDSSESVLLTIDGVGQSDTRIFSVNTVGATTITLDSLKLSQVDSGMVTLILTKQYSPALNEATSKGGLLVGTYRPADRTTLLD